MEKLIYIADDEQNIRELIKTFLQNDGFNVVGFESGDELYEKFIVEPADLVILDIMLPGTDGLSLCSKLRTQSLVPIIIVSARDSELDRITGIAMGGDDYLTKPFSPMELVARVKAIFRRMSFNAEKTEVLQFSNLVIDVNKRSAKIDNSIVDLTPTELSLMIYFLKNISRAVSRDELLKNVWKFNFDVDTRATDDVIKRLRKKLASVGFLAKITTVWGFGFKLEENNENN